MIECFWCRVVDGQIVTPSFLLFFSHLLLFLIISYFVLSLPLLNPHFSLFTLSCHVVAPVILSFLGHVGHLDENSPAKCPVSYLACPSVGGCVVTGTPSAKTILDCNQPAVNLCLNKLFLVMDAQDQIVWTTSRR